MEFCALGSNDVELGKKKETDTNRMRGILQPVPTSDMHANEKATSCKEQVMNTWTKQGKRQGFAHV